MIIEADSGAMGAIGIGRVMVRTPAGEDQIVSCDVVNYDANLEKGDVKN